jgi:hypothetical protein
VGGGQELLALVPVELRQPLNLRSFRSQPKQSIVAYTSLSCCAIRGHVPDPVRCIISTPHSCQTEYCLPLNPHFLLLQAHDYVSAARLAFDLKHPGRLLTVIQRAASAAVMKAGLPLAPGAPVSSAQLAAQSVLEELVGGMGGGTGGRMGRGPKPVS